MDVKPWIVAKLKADSAFLAAIGTADKLQFYYPQSFNELPVVTYAETNQPTTEYTDDAELGAESSLEFHVWTAPNVSTSPIIKELDRVLRSYLFNRDFSADFQEADTRINHRVLRYRRMLTALDLV